MKVLLVVSGLMFGGGQRIVMELAERGTGHDFELGVLLLGRCEKEMDWPNVPFVEYDGRYNRVRTLIATAWRVRCAIREEQPYIIHTHGWDADVIGYLACLGLNVKQLVHLHVTPMWLSSRKVKQTLRRLLTRRVLSSSKVRAVAVSNAVQEHWAKYFNLDSKRLTVVHNGVDVVRYQPSRVWKVNDDIPVVGVAARLAPMKGIEYLLKALVVLDERAVPFRLEIAGVGKLRETLEEIAAQAGISDDVRFLGKIDSMVEFYNRIDVFTLPSISTEGLPLTVLEAMASGVPVIGTKLAGTPEAVREGVDGYLVSPKNVFDLADKLHILLRNPNLRQRLGENARRRAVDAFSLDRFAREVFALYR